MFKNKSAIALIIFVIILIASFSIFRYNSSKNKFKDNKSYSPSQKTEVRKLDFFKDFEAEKKQLDFRTKTDNYLGQLNILQNRIDKVMQLINYLQVKTEEGDKASSIEESLVYEAQYRESFTLLVRLQAEMLDIYKKMVSSSNEYVYFLESKTSNKTKNIVK
jgi:hypothetical protein